jgi:hypothetical protein
VGWREGRWRERYCYTFEETELIDTSYMLQLKIYWIHKLEMNMFREVRVSYA